MSTSEFLEKLAMVLAEGDEDALEELCVEVTAVGTFREVGVMTKNLGLQVTLVDGTRLQLAVLGSYDSE